MYVYTSKCEKGLETLAKVVYTQILTCVENEDLSHDDTAKSKLRRALF